MFGSPVKLGAAGKLGISTGRTSLHRAAWWWRLVLDFESRLEYEAAGALYAVRVLP